MRLRSALIDTNFIVALLVAGDPAHAQCVATARANPTESVLTTCPVIAESMYLLYKMAGIAGQGALYRAIKTGSLLVEDTPEIDIVWRYMNKYADLPLDYGDATLASYAAGSGVRHIFTMDMEFRLVNIPIDSKAVLDVLS